MDAELRKLWWLNGKEQHVSSFREFEDVVAEFVDPRADELNGFLFRGAANSGYTLEPNLLRLITESYTTSDGRRVLRRPWLNEWLLHHMEEAALQQFITRAHIPVARSLPEILKPKLGEKWTQEHTENRWQWWQIMQHHGARTRLLDWTVSLYQAAYFAVTDQPENDGVLWIVDRGAHYDRMRAQYSDIFKPTGELDFPLYTIVRVSTPNDPQQWQALKRVVDDGEAEAKRLNHCLHFFPCSKPDERMAAQRGWLSCCPMANVDHEDAIALAFKGEEHRKWIRRITIAAEAKSEILRALWTMNITGETVYCGLDGLGRAMTELCDLLKPQNRAGKQIEYQLREGILTLSQKQLDLPAPTSPGTLPFAGNTASLRPELGSVSAEGKSNGDGQGANGSPHGLIPVDVKPCPETPEH